MQVGSNHFTQFNKSSVSTKAERPTSESPEPKDWFQPVRDAGVVTRLLGLGQLYRWRESARAKENAKNPPLANEALVKLEDPVVFIPGWTTTRIAFDPLADKLLAGGRNGGELIFVSEGEFYKDRQCTKKCDSTSLQSSEHKVFEMVFSDTRMPPDKSSEEMVLNFSVIKKLTGRDKVDVGAYSMGGLATRAYLDKDGQDIDQVLFLGTPHRGAKFADLARHVLRRDIGWAISFAGLLPADLPALDWLSPVEDGNPQLQALNDRWTEQKSRVNETRFVAGADSITSAGGWWPITDGDGLVSIESAAPPGETAVVLDDQTHGSLNNSAPVYREMADFFKWKVDPKTAAS
jgi:pimeloyl-ACP methyl ester carboxylesterase